jgi:hypothetical protein
VPSAAISSSTKLVAESINLFQPSDSAILFNGGRLRNSSTIAATRTLWRAVLVFAIA